MKKLLIGSLLMAFLVTGAVFAQGDGTGAFEQRKDDIKAKIEDHKSIVTALTPEQLTCVKNAISKREDALIAGHTAYATAITNAYTVRKAALMTAWDKADRTERRNAVRAADQVFHDAVKSARKTWNDARRAAWKTFETDRKACVPLGNISSSETGSSRDDSSL